jgi:hypothetical protein
VQNWTFQRQLKRNGESIKLGEAGRSLASVARYHAWFATRATLRWSSTSVEQSPMSRLLLRPRVLPHTFPRSPAPSWVDFRGRTATEAGSTTAHALVISRRWTHYNDFSVAWMWWARDMARGAVHEGFIFADRRQQTRLVISARVNHLDCARERKTGPWAGENWPMTVSSFFFFYFLFYIFIFNLLFKFKLKSRF